MAALHAACCGFYGKIPARGDFVRCRLPASFVAPWDGWLQQVLAASRELMGEDWQAAWLEAPVWRFALDGGICGADPVLGLWMPSVDRAGRLFPLTLAAIVPAAAPDWAERGGEWFDGAERAGRDAIAADAHPEQLAAALESLPLPCVESHQDHDAAGPADPDAGNGGLSRWWTEGSPRVAARRFQMAGLPDGRVFAAMLDDGIDGAGA